MVKDCENVYFRKHSALMSDPFRVATMDPGIESLASWAVFPLEQSCCGRGSLFVAGPFSTFLHRILHFLCMLDASFSYLFFHLYFLIGLTGSAHFRNFFSLFKEQRVRSVPNFL